MVKEIKRNLGTGILYRSDFLYKITRACKAGEFWLCNKNFVCQLKLAGHKFPIIREKFMKKIGAPAGLP